MFEACLIGDVVDENAAISPSVEGGTKGLKSLLACRVPYLKDYDAILQLDFFVGEVSPNGWLEILCKPSVLEHLD